MSCDGLGDYDWSDMAEEEPNYSLVAQVKPKVHNFALMAYASSSSGSDSEYLMILIYLCVLLNHVLTL